MLFSFRAQILTHLLCRAAQVSNAHRRRNSISMYLPETLNLYPTGK